MDDSVSDTSVDDYGGSGGCGPLRLFQKFRKRCGSLVTDPRIVIYFDVILITNSILVGIATFDFIDGHPYRVDVVGAINTVFLCLFTFELFLQVVYLGMDSFKSPWLVFDFIIILLSWTLESASIVRAVRVVRTFRTFLIFSRFQFLRDIIETIVQLQSSLLVLTGLLLLVMYVFSVLFTEMFGELELSRDYFTSLDRSLFTCLELMTLEWAAIGRQLLEQVAWSWIPVFAFLIISNFIFFNLVIAVICNAVALQDVREGRIEGKDELKNHLEETSKRIAAIAAKMDRIQQSQLQSRFLLSKFKTAGNDSGRKMDGTRHTRKSNSLFKNTSSRSIESVQLSVGSIDSEVQRTSVQRIKAYRNTKNESLGSVDTFASYSDSQATTRVETEDLSEYSSSDRYSSTGQDPFNGLGKTRRIEDINDGPLVGHVRISESNNDDDKDDYLQSLDDMDEDSLLGKMRQKVGHSDETLPIRNSAYVNNNNNNNNNMFAAAAAQPPLRRAENGHHHHHRNYNSSLTTGHQHNMNDSDKAKKIKTRTLHMGKFADSNTEVSTEEESRKLLPSISETSKEEDFSGRAGVSRGRRRRLGDERFTSNLIESITGAVPLFSPGQGDPNPHNVVSRTLMTSISDEKYFDDLDRPARRGLKQNNQVASPLEMTRETEKLHYDTNNNNINSPSTETTVPTQISLGGREEEESNRGGGEEEVEVDMNGPNDSAPASAAQRWGKIASAVVTDDSSDRPSMLSSGHFDRNELLKMAHTKGSTRAVAQADKFRSSSSNIVTRWNQLLSVMNEVHVEREDDRQWLNTLRSVPSPFAQNINEARVFCGVLVNLNCVQAMMTLLVIANALILTVLTFDLPEEVVTRLDYCDDIMLIMFTIEITMQLFAGGKQFFKDGFLVFDLVVVLFSWISRALQVFLTLTLLRAFRIIRTLRLITHLETLRDLIMCICSILPRLSVITIFLLLIFYIFSVLFVTSFGEYNDELSWNYFGALGPSLFTCMQLMTLDWAAVAREVMEYVWWSWIPFVIFVTLANFIIFSLIIACLNDAVEIIDETHEAVSARRDLKYKLQRTQTLTITLQKRLDDMIATEYQLHDVVVAINKKLMPKKKKKRNTTSSMRYAAEDEHEETMKAYLRKSTTI